MNLEKAKEVLKNKGCYDGYMIEDAKQTIQEEIRELKEIRGDWNPWQQLQ